MQRHVNKGIVLSQIAVEMTLATVLCAVPAAGGAAAPDTPADKQSHTLFSIKEGSSVTISDGPLLDRRSGPGELITVVNSSFNFTYDPVLSETLLISQSVKTVTQTGLEIYGPAIVAATAYRSGKKPYDTVLWRISADSADTGNVWNEFYRITTFGGAERATDSCHRIFSKRTGRYIVSYSGSSDPKEITTDHRQTSYISYLAPLAVYSPPLNAEMVGYEQETNPNSIGAISIWSADGLMDRVVIDTAESPESHDSFAWYVASETPGLSLVKQQIHNGTPLDAKEAQKLPDQFIRMTFDVGASVNDADTADVTIPVVNGAFDISHATLPAVRDNAKFFSLKRLPLQPPPDKRPAAR
jgi:hypothetical protein